MATLIYNNVRLDAITTVEHTARVVYDPGGTDYPLKTAQQYAAAWAQGIGMAGAGALSLAAGGPLGAAGAAAGAFGVAELLYNNALATCNLSGVCQVTGAPGADRMYLARVAQSLVADRCRSGGFNSTVTPVVTRVSVDWSS